MHPFLPSQLLVFGNVFRRIAEIRGFGLTSFDAGQGRVEHECCLLQRQHVISELFHGGLCQVALDPVDGEHIAGNAEVDLLVLWLAVGQLAIDQRLGP